MSTRIPGDAAQRSRTARQRFGRWLLVMHLAGMAAVCTLAIRVPKARPAPAAGATAATAASGHECCPEGAQGTPTERPDPADGAAEGAGSAVAERRP